MNFSAPDYFLLLTGLALVFFGLPILRSTLHVFGFVVGASYGVYFYALFSQQNDFTLPVYILIGAIVGIFGGLLGASLANFAQAIFVFLAGGFMGFLIAKIIIGYPIDQPPEPGSLGDFNPLFQFNPIDILWFLLGGVAFVIAIDVVMILVLVIFGSALIYKSVDPLNLMQPEWAIPAIVGIIGFISQEAMSEKIKRSKKVLIFQDKKRPNQYKKH